MFQASVNGRTCVVHVLPGNLRIEHGSGSRDVKYSAIPCVQRSGRRVIVNARVGGRLVSYWMESPGARKLYEELLGACRASSASRAEGSDARNSNP